MTSLAQFSARLSEFWRAGRNRRAAMVVAALFAALFAMGLVPHLMLRHSLASEAETAKQRIPVVGTVQPRRAPTLVEVALPGSMEAVLETGIWARTDGYLKERTVDIGDRVRAGQLLAQIETPEVDQQLEQAIALVNQAKADLVRAEADLALARTTLARFHAAGPGAVSKQQIDERSAAETEAEKTVEAARATVTANDADVHRLRELQSFQKVYAPFDGVITVRNVDPGSLISAGSTSGTTELFRLAQVDVLRTFVFVPQSYAPEIRVGQKAGIGVREVPGRRFEGTVTRTAGALDANSRTLLTEVQVPNRDGALLSGSYVTVTFEIERSEPPLVVPQSALRIDADGVRVARIDADGTLHYQPVRIGRDDGQQVEIVEGLAESDVLATGLPADVLDGSRVEIAPPASDARR